MSSLALYLFIGSMAATVFVLLLEFKREARQPILLLSILGVWFLLPFFTLRLPFRGGVPRGESEDELWLLAALYVSLLAGMLALHFYNRFSLPKRRRPKFDLGLFLAPIFASPIVFIPLYAMIQAVGVDLYHEHGARIMLFLVAFENGFFWKLIFDQRQQVITNREN